MEERRKTKTGIKEQTIHSRKQNGWKVKVLANISDAEERTNKRCRWSVRLLKSVAAGKGGGKGFSVVIKCSSWLTSPSPKWRVIGRPPQSPRHNGNYHYRGWSACVTDAIRESAITVGSGDLADWWRSRRLIRERWKAAQCLRCANQYQRSLAGANHSFDAASRPAAPPSPHAPTNLPPVPPFSSFIPERRHLFFLFWNA